MTSNFVQSPIFSNSSRVTGIFPCAPLCCGNSTAKLNPRVTSSFRAVSDSRHTVFNRFQPVMRKQSTQLRPKRRFVCIESDLFLCNLSIFSFISFSIVQNFWSSGFIAKPTEKCVWKKSKKRGRRRRLCQRNSVIRAAKQPPIGSYVFLQFEWLERTS